ncbi:MAG TPA: hypothetical protein VMB50_03015 [Myxococcales bacterium]|nr:hypothetical protein [Myxococcales bacterium]
MKAAAAPPPPLPATGRCSSPTPAANPLLAPLHIGPEICAQKATPFPANPSWGFVPWWGSPLPHAVVVALPCSRTAPRAFDLGLAPWVMFSVAVDSRNLYWADGERGAVMKQPLNGGSPVVLAGGQRFTGGNGGFLVAGGNVFWGAAGSPDAAGSGAVMKVSVDGGDPVRLAPATWAIGLQLVGSTLWWLEQTQMTRRLRVPVAGGPVESLPLVGPPNP